MRVFLAEKEMQARDIANVVVPEGLEPLKKDGYFLCGDSDVVTWASGHMYEQAEPHFYDPKYKTWRVEDLPIIPERWEIIPVESKRRQLENIHRLLERADIIVHACDADREGQLIGDEILAKAPKIRPNVEIMRLWLHALNRTAIVESLGMMKSNRDYRHQTEAAMTRARADWLVGMNLTRAWTLAAKEAGYSKDEMFTVGRVQTPTLALIVRRDRVIEAFKPTPYFLVAVQIKHENGEVIAAWKPKEGLEGLDKDGRVIKRELADSLVGRIKNRSGRVALNEVEEIEQAPPMPHNLASLQGEANEKHGMTAAQTLTAAQALYERYKIISYPRSDCRYLPESQHGDALSVLHAIARNEPDKAIICENANPDIRSAAWDNGKLSSHHAIVPLATIATLAELTPHERAIYDIVCRAFVAQFYEPARYQARNIEYGIAGETFETKERTLLAPGWRVIYPPKTETTKEKPPLPEMEVGDRITCIETDVLEKQTAPPQRFNEASLLQAMEKIDKHVEEEEIKSRLAGKGGIGTPATRHDIIEKLVEKRFILRDGRKIISTRLGRDLIDALKESPEITSPGLTAIYEQVLERIERGEGRGATFLSKQGEIIKEMVAAAVVAPKIYEDNDEGEGHHGHKPRRNKRNTTPRGDTALSA
jgi:DNA topoisomerase-3